MNGEQIHNRPVNQYVKMPMNLYLAGPRLGVALLKSNYKKASKNGSGGIFFAIHGRNRVFPSKKQGDCPVDGHKIEAPKVPSKPGPSQPETEDGGSTMRPEIPELG